jgi:thiol-disulfide isomerase/thioredoxin
MSQKKENRMNTHLRPICLAILASVFVFWTAGPAGSQPAQVSLGFTLPVPESPETRAYLGLDTQDRFTLDDVDADILIVEIFSMYCPICQREAPRVNALYEKLNAVTNKTVRLIGIGAGNSAYEVNFFKETYTIPFPLFSDGDFAIHKTIGEQGTPFFIALVPGAAKGQQIFFTHSGDIGDLDQFFERLTTPTN